MANRLRLHPGLRIARVGGIPVPVSGQVSASMRLSEGPHECTAGRSGPGRGFDGEVNAIMSGFRASGARGFAPLGRSASCRGVASRGRSQGRGQRLGASAGVQLARRRRDARRGSAGFGTFISPWGRFGRLDWLTGNGRTAAPTLGCPNNLIALASEDVRRCLLRQWLGRGGSCRRGAGSSYFSRLRPLRF
jgi:hypothetical protein